MDSLSVVSAPRATPSPTACPTTIRQCLSLVGTRCVHPGGWQPKPQLTTGAGLLPPIPAPGGFSGLGGEMSMMVGWSVLGGGHVVIGTARLIGQRMNAPDEVAESVECRLSLGKVWFCNSSWIKPKIYQIDVCGCLALCSVLLGLGKMSGYCD